VRLACESVDVVPAVAFAVVVLLTTFAGDGLRAAPDPAADTDR